MDNRETADASARRLISLGLDEAAIIEVIRGEFPDADAGKTVRSAVNWNNDRKNADGER